MRRYVVVILTLFVIFTCITGCSSKKQEELNAKLIWACNVNDLVLAAAAIKEGADVNVYYGEEDDMTLLHAAAAYGWTDMVLLLIESGANVNPRDNNDMTPLQYAEIEGHLETASVIQQNGGIK